MSDRISGGELLERMQASSSGPGGSLDTSLVRARLASTVQWMSATAVGLVMGGLLLIELWFAARFVRKHAVAADSAITDEDCERAASNAADFLSGLTRSQRLQVSRSVVKGRAVADPALAPAATSAAYAAWLKLRVSVARPRWIGGLAAVFWGSLAASRLLTDRGWFWLVVNTIIAAASVWLVYETVVGQLRRAERALKAEQLNLALVAQESSAKARQA